VVRGLDNGSDYTFSVTAFNAAGSSESDTPSTPVRPEPAINPTPMPVDDDLRPGQAQVMENGKPVTDVTITADRTGTSLHVRNGSFTLAVEGIDRRGNPIGLQNDDVLLLVDDGRARTSGSGFRPGSTVRVFLGTEESSPTRSRTSAATMMTLGTVAVNDLGTFTGTLDLPAGLTPGLYVLQVAGVTAGNGERAISLGIRVLAHDTSLILIKGQRTSDTRRLDRLRATGTSLSIPTGTHLVPYYRFGNRGAFTQGKAKITVQDDGTFRWTRKVRANRPLQAYVTFASTKSNTVRWARIR
jgi:hypothetical protein